MPEDPPEPVQIEEAQANERGEIPFSPFEQPLLVKLDKIYKYELKKGEKYNQALENIHLFRASRES